MRDLAVPPSGSCDYLQAAARKAQLERLLGVLWEVVVGEGVKALQQDRSGVFGELKEIAGVILSLALSGRGADGLGSGGDKD